jgi:hypothetical protein
MTTSPFQSANYLKHSLTADIKSVTGKERNGQLWNTSNALLFTVNGIFILVFREDLQGISQFGSYSPLCVGFLMEEQLQYFLAFTTTCR